MGQENRNGRYNIYTRDQRYNRNQSVKETEEDKTEVKKEFEGFKESWIINGADKELIAYADKVGLFMADNGLTNSKIRSIYGEIKRIQMAEYEKETSSFYLLKPKVAYAFARDKKNEGLELFKLIFEKSWVLVSDQKSYRNFSNLMEAILAYHKAHGGKD